MIRIEKIKKSFGSNPVLNELSLTVKDKEIVTILGRSGAGKSVLLNCIIGLLKPESGSCFINNTNISLLHGEALFSELKQIGMLFQSGALFDSLTISENIGFYLTEHRRDAKSKKELSDKEIRERVQEIMADVGLEGTDDLYPSSLSGGMKKRAALARAMVYNPTIMIFDEPTTGLDVLTGQTINELIVETQKSRNFTAIVVTHDYQTALYVSDRIALLDEGKIKYLDTPINFINIDHPTILKYRSLIGTEPNRLRKKDG